jgi:hypothetical protein
MHAVEIQDQARRLFEAMGSKAIAEAAQKAKAHEDAGHEDEARDWRQVEAALKLMQGPRVS